MSELKKQIYLLTILRAIRMFMISIPVIAVYWNSFGMTMRDIMILQVIFSLAWVILEMPSGWLADKFGNKQTIVWGAVIGAFGHWLYWQIPSYTGFVLAELALALSVSLVSGSREALLHDTLEAHGKTKHYTAYQGKLISIGQLSEAASALSAVAVVTYFDITAVLAVQFGVLTLAVPVGRLVFSATSPFMGWVADVWSFGTAFLVSAAVFGVITIFAFGNWLITVQIKAT